MAHQRKIYCHNNLFYLYYGKKVEGAAIKQHPTFSYRSWPNLSQEMKALFHYYKEIQYFNIPLSLIVAVFGMLGSEHMVQGFVATFFLSLLTGGYLLSLYFYELRNKKRYYFYYNKGYSKLRLMLYGFLINLSIFFAVFFLKSLFMA